MAKKQRKKLKKLNLEELKKKIKGKVYIGNETDKQMKELKDSLSNYKDSLRQSQAEVDSLKQVIKVRVK